MNLRSTLLSTTAGLFLLGAFSYWWYALGPTHGEIKQPRANQSAQDISLRTFNFDYQSNSYFNPPNPESGHAEAGLSIACSAKGQIHFGLRPEGTLIWGFYFESLDCNGIHILEDRVLLPTLALEQSFLNTKEAVQQAITDPRLAVARSFFLAMSLDHRQEWPPSKTVWQNVERRAEGLIQVKVKQDLDALHRTWNKVFQGEVTPENNSNGLTQVLEYSVEAKSQESRPLEFGLIRLQAAEHSKSFQQAKLLARTDLSFTIESVSNPERQQLLSWLMKPAISSNSGQGLQLSAQEREKILSNWRRYRDTDGQQSAYGQSQDNQLIYLEIKQALRQEPGLAEELAADLRDIEPTSSSFAVLAGALVYSGEKQALDALIRAAEQHRDQKDWQSNLIALVGLAPQPSEASWRYLEKTRQSETDQSLVRAADLGLATHLKQGYHEQGSEAFIEELQQRMQAANSEDERLHLLDIIGNAGFEQAMQAIELWLNGGSAPLRLRVAQALRHIPSPRAVALLLQLIQDRDTDVALNSMQSLGARTLDADMIEALLRNLPKQSDDRLRLLTLDNLYAVRHQDPELLSKLRVIRSGMKLSPSLMQAWDQIEEDWLDTAGT